MKLTKKIIAIAALSASLMSFAQNEDEVINPVLTGAPFLRIAPDARSGGMGDQGVATSPDAFSQFWNASKYPFASNTSSVAFSYTPYMGKMVNDVFLLYAAFNTAVGDNDRSRIGASIYYFNMGEVNLSELVGSEIVEAGAAKPNEFGIDISYSLKLTDNYSMAVTGKFIRSDLSSSFNTNSSLKAANTFAADVSGYYQSEKFSAFGDYEGRARAGWAIQNLGPKLDYTGDNDSRSYLPTTARLGAGFDLFVDDDSRIGITGEVSKLLVPGSEIAYYTTNQDGSQTPFYEVPDAGVIEGIGKSFSNKKSLMWSGSAEYEYSNAFAVRAGYFHESNYQGARQFATVGVGLKYQSFGLDLSYLINTSKINSALDNTLRIGLTWNIGEDSYDY